MEHLEYYILKLYEHKKKESGLKLGVDRFSPSKRKWAIALLVALVICTMAMMVLLFLWPNRFWFLCGLIPSFVLMIILLAMDAKDRKLYIEDHVKEYNKRINLLQNMLTEYFSIDSKEKLAVVITKFQKYLDEQNKQEQKMNKLAITVLTSFSGIVTTSLANLDSIVADFSGWLNVVILLFVFVCMASTLLYIAFYFMKNLNNKKDRYESIISDLEYIQLRQNK